MAWAQSLQSLNRRPRTGDIPAGEVFDDGAVVDGTRNFRIGQDGSWFRGKPEARVPPAVVKGLFPDSIPGTK